MLQIRGCRCLVTRLAVRPGQPGHEGAEARRLTMLARATVLARSGGSALVSLAPMVPIAVSLAPPSTVTTRAVDRPVVSWVDR
jgi:hypothetical protein